MEAELNLRSYTLALMTGVLLVAGGCGDDNKGTGGNGGGGNGGGAGADAAAVDAPMVDAPMHDAPVADSAEPDAASSCDSVQTLTIASGSTSATATGTTEGAASNLNPMDSNCASGTGPEVVYRVTVPGTGSFRLTASTDFPETMADTVVYMQTGCGSGTELGCNDDVRPGSDTNSVVHANVNGGDTVFVVVDTYDDNSTGPFKLQVSVVPVRSMGQNCDPSGQTDVCADGLVCTPPAGATHTCTMGVAPTLTSAEVQLRDGSTTGSFVYVSGVDPDGDVVTVNLTYKDSGGTMLGSAMVAVPFPRGTTTFSALAVARPTLPAMTASVDVQLVDSVNHMSSVVNAAVVTPKNITQTCSPTINSPDECRHELVCTGTTCAISAATTTLCAAATTLTSGTAVTGSIAATDGDHFEGSCVFVPGSGDKLYKIVVPALTTGVVSYDILANTTTADPFDPSTMLDTYVYIRSTCGDPATEKACNDDVGGGDFRSEATAMAQAPGTYYVVVDGAIGFPPFGAYTLTTTVRPVLAQGQACDPQGVANRCAGTACPTTGSNPVCP
jgi:hypothetical protein